MGITPIKVHYYYIIIISLCCLCSDAVQTVEAVLPALHGRGVLTSVLTGMTPSRSSLGVLHTLGVANFLLLGSSSFLRQLYKMVKQTQKARFRTTDTLNKTHKGLK